METIPHPLALKQGATYREELTSGAGHLDEATGTWVIDTPDNFTGGTARMQIRKKYGEPVLIEISSTPTAAGSITLGGATGTCTIWITDEATDGLVDADGKVIRNALYDLEVEYPSGDVDRVYEGPVTVSPNITRDVAV